MNTNTRDLGFLNFNGQEMNFVKYNGVTVYEAWKKLTESGIPPLTLPKCKGVDLIDYKIYGDSIQDGTPTPEAPIEIESVGDKTINLAPSFYSAYPREEYMEGYKFPVKANTPYSIHFDTSKQAYKTIWLYDIDNNITKLLTYAYINTSYNKMVVIPKQDGYMAVGLMDADAKVIVAEGMYFTLSTNQQNNLNNNGITTSASGELPYEPYGYKIPVKVRGKNIAHPNGKEFNINGIILTPNENGTLTISGSATNSTSTILHWCGRKDMNNYWHDFIIYPHQKVSISIRNAETNEIVRFNANKQFMGVVSGKTYYGDNYMNADEPVYFSRLYTQRDLIAGENIYAGTWKVQVEINDVVTDYEPYVEPFKVESKNMLKNPTYTDQKTQYWTAISSKESITYKKGVTYTISFDTPNTQKTVYFTYYARTEQLWQSVLLDGTRKSFTITPTEDITGTAVISVSSVVADGESTGLCSNCMIEVGDVATDYEPYSEPTYPSIKLDEPLRKIGNYADYIDFENKKIVRNIRHIDFTGEETWVYTLDGVNKTYNTATRTVSGILDDGATINCCSNRFIGIRRNGLYSYGDIGISAAISTIRVHYPTLTEDVDTFKDFLKNNPTNIDYVLATPVEETIELFNLPTFKGTTILEVDTTIQPSNMEVTYLGKE